MTRRHIWSVVAAAVFLVSALAAPLSLAAYGQVRAKGFVYFAVVTVFALGAAAPFPRVRLFCTAAALVPAVWALGSFAGVFYLAMVPAGVIFLGLELKSFSRLGYVVAGASLGLVLTNALRLVLER
jgi:hypothetical protein